MAVSAWWFAKAFLSLANKEIDWNDGNMLVMLLTNANAPDQDADDYISDLDGDEVEGTGYTAEGQALASYTQATSENVCTFDAANTTWSTSTITAQFAVVYYNTGTNTNSPVMCWVDFGQDETSSSGDFTISWNASGIATISATNYA